MTANGTMLYAGQEIELLNLKIYTNVDSRFIAE